MKKNNNATPQQPTNQNHTLNVGKQRSILLVISPCKKYFVLFKAQFTCLIVVKETQIEQLCLIRLYSPNFGWLHDMNLYFEYNIISLINVVSFSELRISGARCYCCLGKTFDICADYILSLTPKICCHTSNLGNGNSLFWKEYFRKSELTYWLTLSPGFSCLALVNLYLSLFGLTVSLLYFCRFFLSGNTVFFLHLICNRMTTIWHLEKHLLKWFYFSISCHFSQMFVFISQIDNTLSMDIIMPSNQTGKLWPQSLIMVKIIHRQ